MNKQHLLAFLYMGLAYAILRLAPGVLGPATVDPVPSTYSPPDAAVSWFQAMKPYCNAVEVETRLRQTPAPRSIEGASYAAACFALAGKIEQAREIILDLSGDDRWGAVGVVFSVGHPVADAGDDKAAGPIMELVVEFWPNHYMALYHAGAARYETGDRLPAQDYLTRFLQHYDADDGWTESARRMLGAMKDSC